MTDSGAPERRGALWGVQECKLRPQAAVEQLIVSCVTLWCRTRVKHAARQAWRCPTRCAGSPPRRHEAPARCLPSSTARIASRQGICLRLEQPQLHAGGDSGRSADGAMASVVTFSRKSRKARGRRGGRGLGARDKLFFPRPVPFCRRLPCPACCVARICGDQQDGRPARSSRPRRRHRRRQATAVRLAAMPAARPPPTSLRPRC